MMMRFFYSSKALIAVLLLELGAELVQACTNIIVTPSASADGNMLYAYSADSHMLYGQLYHYPSVEVIPGSTMDVYDWDSGEYHGKIPQEAPKGQNTTYNVVGNCNQHNLCIGETTFGGLEELANQPGGIIDYGSLIWITLQRTKTAVEAREFMTTFVQQYGYASEGESFSIVDPHEAYLLEMIGKGPYGLGTVWVSCQVPDGAILAHANHARIANVLDDENCIHSEDVVDFAIQTGLYEPATPDDFSDFSFAGIYDPKKSFEMRYTDARVWDIYRAFMTPADRAAFDNQYLSHVMGQDVKNEQVLPLFLRKPSQKIAMDDVRTRMSSHYEDSPLDFRNDVASGLFNAPYRPRPNSWTFQGKTYVNERAIAVPKTGWNFIAHLKTSDQVAHECLQTVLWFAADECSTAPRVPVFPCATAVSSHYYGVGPQQGQVSPIMEWDLQRAFWIQNMVSNFVYARWEDAYPVLQKKLDEVQRHFESKVEKLEQDVQGIATQGNEDDTVNAEIAERVNAFTVGAGDELHAMWIQFYGQLFVTYRDYVEMKVDPSQPGCGCASHEVGIRDAWKERIVAERGEHYEVPNGDQEKSWEATKSLRV